VNTMRVRRSWSIARTRRRWVTALGIDRRWHRASGREFAAALPNARYEEIPGTHMSSVTKPDLGEKIAEFLAAV